MWDLDILPESRPILLMSVSIWNTSDGCRRLERFCQDRKETRPTGLRREHWGAPMCRSMQLHRFRPGILISNSLMVSDPVFDDFYPRAMAAAGTEGVKNIQRSERACCPAALRDIPAEPENFGLCQPWVKGYNGQFGATCGHMAPPAPLLLSGPVLDRLRI